MSDAKTPATVDLATYLAARDAHTVLANKLTQARKDLASQTRRVQRLELDVAESEKSRAELEKAYIAGSSTPAAKK